VLKIRGAELRGRFRRRAVMPSRAVGSVAAAAVGRPSIQHVHPHTGPPHAGRAHAVKNQASALANRMLLG
jgi:hypothetical protein